jgi:acyl-CoA synthetase (AMP-forming)/AMP-acid ligase II
VLRTMPRVADVRVVGAADPVRGQQIVACVVPRGGEVTALEVRQYCAPRLAAYKIPRAVVLLERMPLTARGKISKHELEVIVEAWLRGSRGTGVL